MDLWDLTKLLLRRWYFAVPMLVASVVTVYLMAQSVTPDYKAKGYLQLVPPRGSTQVVDPKAKPHPHNPWVDLGYGALGNASALRVTDKSTLERFAAMGLSDNVTVIMGSYSPYFDIEVVGASPAQATATVREIIKLLDQDITASQRQFGVYPEDMVTTYVLNDGSNVEVVTTKRKRVLIVSAGVGVLLTAAATIALDALLRRRGRRRPESGYTELDPPTAVVMPPRLPDLTPAPAPRPTWRDNAPPTAPIPGPVLSLPAGALSEPPRVTYEMAEPHVSLPRLYPDADERRRPGPYLYAHQDAEPAARDDPNDDMDVPSDATIVLPLAYLSKRDDRNTKH